MFTKFTVIAAASMAVFVAAAPAPSVENSCNTGPVQCCNSSLDSRSDQANILYTLLGVAAGPVGTQLGLTCNPITAVGAGGNSCNSQPVCCSNNNFSGLIAIGCSPININA